MKLAAWALLAFLAASAQAASSLTVEELFAMLARERPTRATFEERKYLALLDRPADSSGELIFTPPARLEKRTIRPRAETLVVDGDAVSVESRGKRRTLALSEAPAVAALIESIRGTLAGDLAALTRNYSVGLDGSLESWRLVLRPLERTVAPVVARVEIAGTQAQVRSVEIFQADGDRSVMTISPSR